MLRNILLVAAVLLAGLLLWPFTPPDTFTVQRSRQIQASSDQVHALIHDLRAFNRWNPYDRKDPALQSSYSGPAAGPGARYAFKGNREVGEGSLTTTASTPQQVGMRLDMRAPMEAHNDITFTRTPKAGGTEVTWAMRGHCPYIARRMGLFFDMDWGLSALIFQVRTERKGRPSRPATTPRPAAWAGSGTRSGALCALFPTGCGQKSHAGCCADLPGGHPGGVHAPTA
ncbi:MAG: SRPBCC family protein [Curvibacter sp.]